MSLDKVLIGTPVHTSKKYCWDNWVRAVNALTFPSFDLLLIDNSENLDFFSRGFENLFRDGINVYIIPYKRGKVEPVRELVAKCQELIRGCAIEDNYDYLFMLEQDNIPAPDTIEYLISQKKEVVGLPYWKYDPDQKLNYVVWQQLYNTQNPMEKEALLTPVMDVLEQFDGGLKQVFNIGLGCLLIKKRVLPLFSFRVEQGESPHSDTYVAKSLFIRSIPVYVSTERFCDHYDTGYQRAELTDKGKKMLKAVEKAVKQDPKPSKKLFLRKLRYRCKNQRL